MADESLASFMQVGDMGKLVESRIWAPKRPAAILTHCNNHLERRGRDFTSILCVTSQNDSRRDQGRPGDDCRLSCASRQLNLLIGERKEPLQH
jgi:hypothetical protein